MKFLLFLVVLLLPVVAMSGGHREFLVRVHGDGIVRQYYDGVIFTEEMLEAIEKRYGSDIPVTVFHPTQVTPSVLGQLEAAGFWMIEIRTLPRMWWFENQWRHHRRRSQWLGLCLLFLVGFLIWLGPYFLSLRKQRALKK